MSCCCFFLRTIISRSSSEPNLSENRSSNVPTSPMAIRSIWPYILSRLSESNRGFSCFLRFQELRKSVDESSPERSVETIAPPSSISIPRGSGGDGKGEISGASREIPGGGGGRGMFRPTGKGGVGKSSNASSSSSVIGIRPLRRLPITYTIQHSVEERE